jgi:hypothetical protein
VAILEGKSTMTGIDYSKRYRDYAVFVPSVSEMYSRCLANKNPKRPLPVPAEDLNFLNPNSNIFFIPYALYSAGQAAKSETASLKRDCMFALRDKERTTVIGDSGGYQIQTRAIRWQGDKTREIMMRWLEGMTDWSMILDFPTGGINLGSVDPHVERLRAEGVDLDQFCRGLGFNPLDYEKFCFSACLYQTLQNNNYFIEHRKPGATKFLNVVQGRTVEESRVWYNKVKHYDFEAWALAGPHKENFEMTMTRLIDMWRDGLLEKKNWLHFLGVGKLQHGAVYTTMQRCIRELINPNFTISYDVSSPFTLAAYGKCYFGYTLDQSGWSVHGDKIDGREFLPGAPRAKVPFLDKIREEWERKGLKDQEQGGFGTFVNTEIGKRLTMDQVCVNEDLKFTSTWDVVSYALMMNHNVQVHLEGVFASQDMYDRDDRLHVPLGLLRFRSLIPDIFAAKDPYAMIRRFAKDLNYLATETAERGIQKLDEFDVPLMQNLTAARAKVREFTRPKKYESQIYEEGGLFGFTAGV